MGYLVYNTDSLRIVAAYRTLDEAQSAAAADTDLSHETTDFVLSPYFKPSDEWYYFQGQIVPEAVPTGKEPLRDAAWDSHIRLLALSQVIGEKAAAYQIGTLNKGHSFIAGALQALYIILHRTNYTDSAGDMQDYTFDQKVAFCRALPVLAEENITAGSFLSDVSASDLPTGPVTWVDPRTGATIAFGESIELSGPSPDDGSAYNLDLTIDEIPEAADFIGIEWVETLINSLPGAPTGLRLFNIMSNKFTVAWTPPADTGGESLTGHLVQWKLSSAAETEWYSFVAPILPFSGELQLPITGLESDTQYDIRIAAINSVGLGPWASVMQGTTMA